jgi:hypothetical protein
MEIKSKLQNYQYILKTAERFIEQIKRLETSLTTGATICFDGVPGLPEPRSFKIAKLVDMKNDYEKMYYQALNERLSVEYKINLVGQLEPRSAYVLRLIFIDNKSIQDVAEIEERDERTIYRWLKRAINMFDNLEK